MAEFILGRIKFVYRNNWDNATAYVVDDVVTTGGKTYICISNHTSSSLFGTDYDPNPAISKWSLLADGQQWREDWTAETYYNTGDLVKYGGIVYLCVESHTSATYTTPDYLGLEDDSEKWNAFATSFNWLGNWATGTRYKAYDIVAYGGTVYICNTPHISAATTTLGLEDDLNNWDTFNAGIVYRNTWSGSTVRYRVNDVVKYGADLWICTTYHTSSSNFDDTKWSVFINGFEFESSWSSATKYQLGDVVTYGGYSYIAKTNNNNKLPTTNASDWAVYTTGFNFVGDWDNTTDYKVGDLVRLGGYSYVATADNTDQVPPDIMYWERVNSGLRNTGSTVSYTAVSGTAQSPSVGTSATFNVSRAGTVYTVTVNNDGTNFVTGDVVVIDGSDVGGITPANDITITVTASSGNITSITWEGISVTWVDGTDYVLGDIVFFGANTYTCVDAHTAATGNRPDNDSTAAYWNLLAAGAESATLTTAGDTLYYGPNGPTRLPIGRDGQVLRVTNGYPSWETYGHVFNAVYVGPTGVDLAYPAAGFSIDKPWKTVRFAAKQIEEGYRNRGAKTLLEINKQFLIKETRNFIDYTYKASVTGTNLGAFTTASTAGLTVGMPIQFSNLTGSLTILSNPISTSTVYYVKTITTNSSFTVSTTHLGAVATAAGTGSATAAFSYDGSKAERDASIIIDGLVYDISHGGTQKTTANTLSFYDTSGTAYITDMTGYQINQFIGSHEYLKTIVANVLNNTATTANYQTLNAVTAKAYQQINLNYTAEAGSVTDITALLDIIINGLTQGDTSTTAAAINPNTSINIKTGTYSEVLPIVVPSNTALVGDELRSTVIQPKSANAILVNDKEKTIGALNRVKSLIPSVVSNTPVVPSSGNTAVQQYLYTTEDTAATESITSNTATMIDILSNGLTATPTYVLTTPTAGTGNAYTAGYFNAARLINANKQFLKDEVTAYMIANYNSVWTGLGTSGQEKCTRDVGYIVDALRYDLTYGGNLATVIAARSYYSNGTFVEPLGEKTAALAVQTRLKDIIDNIATGNTAGWTKSAGNTSTQYTTGTAGSSTAGIAAQDRIQEIYNTINTGTTPTTIVPDYSWTTDVTTFNAIQSAKSAIQSNVIAWIDNTYPDLTYNTTTCSRDAGYIVDALCYDMVFGSNFLSSWNAMSYYRALASTAVVLDKQYAAQVAMIGFISASVKEYTGSTAGSAGTFVGISRAVDSAKIVYDIVNSGQSAVPSFQFTNPVGYNTSYLATFGDGKAQVVQNYNFIVADVLQYYANGSYASVWSSTTTEGRDKGKRDIKLILDALQHDMTYGGNVQSLVAGSAYYSSYLLNISAAEKPAFLDLFGFMKTLVGKIVRKDAITAQSGNTVTRVSSGNAGNSTAGTFAEARIQDVIDWITNGEAPTAIAPSITWADTSLQTAYAAVQAKRTEIVLDATAWVRKFYQEVVLSTDLTERDSGLIVDAIAYDMVLGTNFNAVAAGRRYLSGTTSTETLLNGPIKAPTLGAINFIKYKVKNIVASGAIAQIQTTIDDITGTIAGGKTPRISYPEPVLPAGTYSSVTGTNLTGTGSSAAFNFVRTAAGFTASVATAGSGYVVGNTIKILGSAIGGATPANDIVLTVATISGSGVSTVTVSTFKDAVVLLEDNRGFILDETIAYINYTYPSLEYDETLTRRDAGYILDALHYDLTYGGDFASQQAGQAYYSFGTSEISTYVKTATLDAIDHLSTVAQAVVQNTSVTATTGNTGTQLFKNGAQTAGSELAATTIDALVTKVYNYVNLGLTSGAPVITITAIATTDTFTSNAHGLANGDLVEMLAGTTNGLTQGTTYYVVGASTNTFKLASTYGGTALTTFTNGTGLSISVHKTNLPYIGWVNTDLQTQYSVLNAAKSTIQANVVSFIDDTYANLVYDSALASRDAGLNIDAVCYDFMLNSNFRAVKSGQSYRRPQSSPLLGRLLDSTRESLKYLQTQITDTLYANQTAINRANSAMRTVIGQLVNGVGENPEMTGTTTYNNDLRTITGVEILRANKDFLAAEATAWVDNYYGGNVSSTSSSGNTLTTSVTHNLSAGDPVKFTFTSISTVATASDSGTKKITLGTTAGIVVGMPVTFTGTLFGGVTQSPTVYYVTAISGSDIKISETNGGSDFAVTTGSGLMSVSIGGVMGGVSANTIYYVLSTPSITTFTITAEQNSTTPVTLTSRVGSMEAGYAYDATSCQRDMSEFINALIYDIQYTGNYKSKRAAHLYLNAVNGSQLSDMFHVRNASGIRNMTMSGLVGPLSVPNDYGTKRPEGGAYTSLDPGFGPYDTNAWVNSRSCYVQNCSLFGNGATALKIDGALHAGGNRSIVANDYTTFISDGIGTWCTGSNALTELVSVFAYYSYAGYLAELGGKIRATNGNSSYGTYGVIAEGVDTYETPLFATLNNRGEDAYITNVVTDGADEVLRIEFANAGINYTNADFTISGAGYNATVIGDEFRDYGVFETRLTDLDDGYGYGGSGYLTAANAAQLSTIGTLNLAASDNQLSTAYIGMRALLTAGTGAGQYGVILNYNNGSKTAKVYKESFTPLTVTATTAGGNNLLTVASTATLYVGMPIYLGTAIGGLSANTLYYVIAANFSSTQFAVSTSSGGSAETTTLTSGQTVSLYAAGWDHVVPGATITNSLDLTTTYIIEPRVTFTGPGYTASGRTLASSATWQAVTYGANAFVAIPTGSAATSYSANGTTWSGGGNLPSSTTWVDVAYGGGEGATATAVVGGLGGIGAQLTAVMGSGVTAGQVESIIVVEGGFGYLTPPTITFTGTGGSGTVARAVVLDGAITEVIVTIPGSGWVGTPTVNASTDIITSFTMNSWGKNYTSPPTITVSGGGSTNQATGTASLTNNGVSSIAVGNSGGTGYTSQPTVTILDGNAKFVAIPTTASGGTTKAALQTVTGASTNATWTASTGSLPNGTYASITYGGGYWVALGGASYATRSADGNTWISVSIPTLGSGTYSSVSYGNQTFVAIATGTNATAISTTSGNSWVAGGNMPSSTTWTSVAYGNGRFVAIAASSRNVAYSLDKGTTWVASPAGLPSSVAWTKVTYGQGLFIAVASGTTVCATSPDGVIWTQQAMPSSSNWKAIAFGNPTVSPVITPVFVAVSNTSGQVGASIRTGATPMGRAKVASNRVTEIRMFEPGSGFPKGTVTATTTSTNVITTSDTTNLVALQPVEFTGLDDYGLVTDTTYYVTTGSIVSNTSFKVSTSTALASAGTSVNLTTGTGLSGMYMAGPTVTQTDPNKTRTAPTRTRVGTGVLGQPTFSNRGTANTTATANVTGDGYSDLYQPSSFVNVAGLYAVPTAGANVEFASIPGQWFKLVSVGNILGQSGNYTATFQINPALSVLNAPAHNDPITTRLKYSQSRLTGHDFLYIGTGGFAATNYPEVNVSTAITANQTLGSNGGRVFFTSTDQDGNFNVGGLFGVQQSTGTATLNASAFNLSGLQSLQLGTVSVGAGSAVITSFSTDPYFTANSDNILPTQKAIKSYITAQIGGGQSSLNVNTLTSGVIYVANNTISTTSNQEIRVKAKMNFTGGIDGAPVALAYFMQR